MAARTQIGCLINSEWRKHQALSLAVVWQRMSATHEVFDPGKLLFQRRRYRGRLVLICFHCLELVVLEVIQ